MSGRNGAKKEMICGNSGWEISHKSTMGSHRADLAPLAMLGLQATKGLEGVSSGYWTQPEKLRSDFSHCGSIPPPSESLAALDFAIARCTINLAEDTPYWIRLLSPGFSPGLSHLQ